MRNRFQYEVATGRTTLPAAVIISLIIWAVTYSDKWELVPFIIGGLTTYSLIELNTTFALIRTRTSLPACFFVLFYSVSLFLHNYGNGECWVLLLLTTLMFGLLRSYDSRFASTNIFHSFLCIGISCLIEPSICLLVPVIYICMAMLRSLSLKTFFAGIIGFGLPFWFIIGYDSINWHELGFNVSSANNTDMFRSLYGFKEVFNWSVAQYSDVSITQWLSLGCVSFLSLFSGVMAFAHSYKDKVRTRIIIRVVILMGTYITLIILVKPVTINSLLPTQIALGGVLYGYIMALISNRFTFVFMILSFILIASIAILNFLI